MLITCRCPLQPSLDFGETGLTALFVTTPCSNKHIRCIGLGYNAFGRGQRQAWHKDLHVRFGVILLRNFIEENRIIFLMRSAHTHALFCLIVPIMNNWIRFINSNKFVIYEIRVCPIGGGQGLNCVGQNFSVVVFYIWTYWRIGDLLP
jgi:hypothetical protein